MRRDEPTPPGWYLIIVIFWLGFCFLLFRNEQGMSFPEMIGLALFFLWVFFRMFNYKGRYRPKILYALRIVGLPMLCLFVYFALIGKL